MGQDDWYLIWDNGQKELVLEVLEYDEGKYAFVGCFLDERTAKLRGTRGSVSYDGSVML